MCIHSHALIFEHKHTPDALTFALVRWFTAHPSAVDRDSLCRPVCPGPLKFNHCLWTFATSDRPRRMMVNEAGAPSKDFLDCAHVFGRTARQQQQNWDEEKNAYFGLITPANIVSRLQMAREYDPSSMEKTDVWLETVTLV